VTRRLCTPPAKWARWLPPASIDTINKIARPEFTAEVRQHTIEEDELDTGRDAATSGSAIAPECPGKDNVAPICRLRRQDRTRNFGRDVDFAPVQT
jgi:hypothetical protein